MLLNPIRSFSRIQNFIRRKSRIKPKYVYAFDIRGGGGGGSTPTPLKNARFFFFSKYKKCLECSETKEYAKIFRGIFAGESYKNEIILTQSSPSRPKK